jgi:hypothetical protein
MYVVRVLWSPEHATHFRKTLSFLRYIVRNHVRKLDRRYFEKTQIRWFSAREVLQGCCEGGRLRRVFADTLARHKQALQSFIYDPEQKPGHRYASP